MSYPGTYRPDPSCVGEWLSLFTCLRAPQGEVQSLTCPHLLHLRAWCLEGVRKSLLNGEVCAHADQVLLLHICDASLNTPITTAT